MSDTATTPPVAVTLHNVWLTVDEVWALKDCAENAIDDVGIPADWRDDPIPDLRSAFVKLQAALS